MDTRERDQLFRDMVKKYSLLFWLCLALFVVFAGYAAFFAPSREARAVSGALAIACLYGAKTAPRSPWTKKSRAKFAGLGEHEDEFADPLPGDRSPDAPTVVIRTTVGERVSLSAEDPEPGQEDAPPAPEQPPGSAPPAA